MTMQHALFPAERAFHRSEVMRNGRYEPQNLMPVWCPRWTAASPTDDVLVRS